jgi:hypothetical protein
MKQKLRYVVTCPTSRLISRSLLPNWSDRFASTL